MSGSVSSPAAGMLRPPASEMIVRPAAAETTSAATRSWRKTVSRRTRTRGNRRVLVDPRSAAPGEARTATASDKPASGEMCESSVVTAASETRAADVPRALFPCVSRSYPADISPSRKHLSPCIGHRLARMRHSAPAIRTRTNVVARSPIAASGARASPVSGSTRSATRRRYGELGGDLTVADAGPTVRRHEETDGRRRGSWPDA